MSNKITKRESFKMIIEVLENNDRADLVEVMNHEIELLDKKKASGKMTKTQTENVGIKELILQALDTIGEPVTITDLLKNNVALYDAVAGSNQKVSALMTQLKKENKVVRTTNGKKALFSIAEEE